MPSLASRIPHFVLKLFLGLFAAIFAVSLLAAALIVVALSLLKALVTGRKPAPAAVFGRFRQFSAQGMWPGGAGRENAAHGGDVVDVEVREVREDRRLP
ncbi:hypothetical protein [Polaromonas jejuensis]|uniref:Uncharacterized protein n=1 Tax=Polaromonas jejuensis TaxID=457502 RepID=A0ABW0QCB8_9BURK|nr:hypothetical protein [Polaromonas jejuensis]